MLNTLSAAISELAAAGGSVAALTAAVSRIAASHFGLQGYTVGQELPNAQRTPELDCFLHVAGAMIGQAHRSDQAASDYDEVISRLEQLHRDLDNAQRSEWIAHERMRIAQDLHDRVAQTLFGIGLKSDWLLTNLEKDERLRPDLERVKQLASTGLRQVREAIFSLSSGPVEAGQLRQAIQGLLKEMEAGGITGDLQTLGDPTRIPPDVADGLYQIVREALVNVRRHSGASTVLVSLRITDDAVTAVIQDDGRGLAEGVAETYKMGGAHLGLRGMESRVTRLGGSLWLAPGDECGLVVTARIPLRPH